jgi:SPP1 family predicted phage head-tail adaptor
MKRDNLSGRLRHRIIFEYQTTTRDSDGIASTVWDVAASSVQGYLRPLHDVPALVLTGPGREFLASGQMQSEIAARITCRWFPGLDASWRIRWGDLVYNIRTWDTDETGRIEYRIRCVAGVNDGE